MADKWPFAAANRQNARSTVRAAAESRRGPATGRQTEI